MHARTFFSGQNKLKVICSENLLVSVEIKVELCVMLFNSLGAHVSRCFVDMLLSIYIAYARNLQIGRAHV